MKKKSETSLYDTSYISWVFFSYSIQIIFKSLLVFVQAAKIIVVIIFRETKIHVTFSTIRRGRTDFKEIVLSKELGFVSYPFHRQFLTIIPCCYLDLYSVNSLISLWLMLKSFDFFRHNHITARTDLSAWTFFL